MSCDGVQLDLRLGEASLAGEVLCKRLLVSLNLLDNGEFGRAGGLCARVDGELVRGGEADDVWSRCGLW